MVANLISERTFVHSVAAHLAHVRGAETASNIETKVGVLAHVIHHSYASGKSVERARELLEAHLALLLKRVTMQMARVVAQTAAYMQPVGIRL